MRVDATTYRRIAALATHESLLLARAPGPLIGYTVMPLLLMTVLQPTLERLSRVSPLEVSGTAHAAAGMAVMFALFALKLVGADLLQERTWHTWDRLRASPALTSDVVIGKALPMLGVLLLHQAIILGFAAVMFGLRPTAPWWAVALVATAWSICILVLGAAAATLVRTPAQLSAAGDIAAIVTSILGGAMVPIAVLPAWLRAIAPLSPGYWAMRCYWIVLDDPATVSTTASVFGLVAFAAVGILASASLVRRRPA
jgi:ABC-2 type transport system permease protein